MVNPNDPASFNSLNREEVLRELKPILGEEYCDWNASLLYTITKMANDITHFKIDNQVWYDKSQELQGEIEINQTRIQELQNEVATHLQALQRGKEWHESQKRELTEQKDQIIQQLQSNLTETQAKVNQQEQTIANLNQTNQTQQTQLQETQELNQKLQQDNQELLKDIHTYKQTIQTLQTQTEDQTQRILALEADKSDLIHQLTQAKEIYQNHLNQEKSYLTKEIQLIKEVIH